MIVGKVGMCALTLFVATASARAVTTQITWLGVGTDGDLRWGLHSRTLGEPSEDSFYELPRGPRVLGVHGGEIFSLRRSGIGIGIEFFAIDMETSTERTLYTVGSGFAPWNFVEADGNLYIADSLDDEIWRSGFDGSNAQIIYDSPVGVPSPTYITITGSTLFWTESNINIPDRGLGSILGLDLEDPSQVTTYLTGLNRPDIIASSDTHLFWYDANDRAIYRTDLGGNNQRAIASGTQAFGLIVDDDYVYWANREDLMRSDHNGANQELVLTSGDLIQQLYFTQIPEPSGVCMLLVGGVIFAFRRRRCL